MAYPKIWTNLFVCKRVLAKWLILKSEQVHLYLKEHWLIHELKIWKGFVWMKNSLAHD